MLNEGFFRVLQLLAVAILVLIVAAAVGFLAPEFAPITFIILVAIHAAASVYIMGDGPGSRRGMLAILIVFILFGLYMTFSYI